MEVGKENDCIATNKTSLLEDEGNAENAFPAQQADHYERVRIRFCYGCQGWVSLAWYERPGLIAQQISSDDECSVMPGQNNG